MNLFEKYKKRFRDLNANGDIFYMDLYEIKSVL